VIRSALLAAALLSSSCGADDPERADTRGQVHGTVRDAQSGDAIKGVQVRFVSDTLDEASDTTDGDGRYRIDVVTDTDRGHLEATKSGYARRVVSVYLDDESVAIDIDLSRP
jgi:hypothetical protein